METLETPQESLAQSVTPGLLAPEDAAHAPVALDDAVPRHLQEVTRAESVVTRLLMTLGLDRAVIFTVLARGWSSLAGIATLTLIAHFVTRVEQGYYYTFYSMVALQIVFELGFSTVILQSASHEAAHLEIEPDGPVTGPEIPHARLASVLQKSVRWYSLGAVLMMLVLLPVGMRFFSTGAMAGTSVKWLAPWCLVVIASGFTFQIDPLFSFFEGCGFVSNVARVRLGQAIAGSVLGWLALVSHHGLFAPGCMIAGQAAVGGVYMARRRGLLLGLMRHAPGELGLNWKTEVWPFQWRIAVSWICGFFITQLFNPVLFRYHGAVEAGRMGMSISICGTLTSMCVAWINTKAAPFGRLIALKDYPGLDRMFFRALRQSMAAACVVSLGVWLTVVYLRIHQVPFATRLLAPAPFGLMLLATVANILVFAEALYLRAHKQEKFMINSILGALWMAPATLLLGRWYGAYGIAIGYVAGTLAIGVGLGTYTFARYRRLWHG